MAGHSKWANIRHRKAAQDSRRGKLFSKLIREITVAAKLGGPAIEDNPRLRMAVEKAQAANMTRDTLDRAIARGSGDRDGSVLEEISYEGYGPGGAALYLEVMTDNRNRTVAEVRRAFVRYGGQLGTDGSVAYLFVRCGQIFFAPGVDQSRLMDLAVEAGALDVEEGDDGTLEVITEPGGFEAIRGVLLEAGLEIARSEIGLRPTSTVLLDTDQASALMELMTALEELDDVQQLYCNAEFPDSLLGAVEA